MLPAAFNRPVFATERVRFVGDIVAAVVAESGAQAVDAAEAVIVEVDPLPAMVSQASALAPDATLLFPDAESNVCFGTAFGADEDPLVDADVVAEVAMVSQRLAGVPMEPNGCLMVPGEPPGGITCWLSHQAPHSAQPASGRRPRPRSGGGARGLPVGGRWLRPQGRGVRRVPGGRGRGPATGPAGEVGRDPLGGHGRPGARA